MAVKPAGFLLATATQGSADAFAQTTITTGLSLIGNNAYQIRGIHYAHSKLLAVDNVEMTLGLARRSKTATPNWTDPDCIWYYTKGTELATSGAFITESGGMWVPPGPTYIVEDYIYLQIDSSNTSASNSVLIRIEYDLVRITDAERNGLLSRTVLSSVSS
jgi:hypothetical protein